MAFPSWKVSSVEFCNCFVGTQKYNSQYVVRQYFLNHLENNRSSVSVFMDALSLMLVLGLGVVIPCEELPNNAFVFTSELFSIFTTLKRIVNYGDSSFTIFSYSRGILILSCTSLLKN